MVDLRRDLVRGANTDLLWFSTTEQHPGYMRISVLDNFDGTSWKPSDREIPVGNRASGRMPRPPGLDPEVGRTEVPYQIRIGGDFQSQWLPAPYPVSNINAPGDWRFDPSTQDFLSAEEDQNSSHLTYSLTALDVDISVNDLVYARPAPPGLRVRYTRLPLTLPASVRTLAADLTRDATSKFDAAVRLQTWFRETGGFTYSLHRARGNGNNDLVAFLSKSGRVGYCEQFAAAMAVLGRAVNIPSRVVVGFLRPDHLSGEDWVYRAHDLHAWPEMYFEGVGWVRFEPTPQDRATTVPGYTLDQVPSGQPSAPDSSSAPLLPSNRFGSTPGPRPGDVGSASGGGATLSSLVPALAVLAVVVLLLLVPRTTRRLVRRRRWRVDGSAAAIAAAAWAELRDTARDLGSRWSDDLSPRAMARVLASGFGVTDPDRRTGRSTGVGTNPEADRALERIALYLERVRYARFAEAVPGDLASMEADVLACVDALYAGAGTSRRRRAEWWPRSVTRRLSSRAETRRPMPGMAAVDHAV